MKTAALILGLLGALLGFPSALCSGACAAGISSVGNVELTEDGRVIDHDEDMEESASAGNAFLALGLIGSLIALVGAIKVRGPGKKGAFLLLVGLCLNGVTAISLNPLAMLVVALLTLATIFGFIGEDPVPEPSGA